MTTIANSIRYKLPLLLVTLLATIYSFAQEVTTSASHTSETSSATVPDTEMWYNAPWVWIAGVALLLLIIVLLIRGGRSKDRVIKRTTTTTTTTLHTDDD